MPNRIIKESICTSDSVDQLSWFEESFFYRLTVNCDDYGRMDARPAILKSRLFPLKEGVTLKQIEAALSKLSTVGMVQVYKYDQKPFLQLINWGKHQSVRNKRSKYPEPPALEINCMQVNADVPVIQSLSVSLSESNPEYMGGKPPKKRKQFIPPALEEIQAYCQERNSTVDPQKFYDYFTADPEKAWIDGKGNPVRNWKQKIITWEGNANASNRGNNAPKSSPGDNGEGTPKYGDYY